VASQVVSSWGNVISAEHAIVRLASRHDAFPEIAPGTNVLPYGNGRSYGDSCLNVGGALLQTRALDRFIAFDTESGALACESGVLLADILKLAVPRGWFLPVSPGTQFVTVGGAIANDVHGKNHHHTGTFGRHVRRFELLRSDGQRIECAAGENPDWFAATVGGLGLTGAITRAEIQLRRIASPLMDVETIRFSNLDEFLALCAESDHDFEYTVAWIDCLGKGPRLGRGLLQRANHAEAPARIVPAHPRRVGIPFTPPFSLINAASLRLFNTTYYHRQRGARNRSIVRFEPFFYPLDNILHWNRLYGPRGLYQYQCVIPSACGRDATEALLGAIARSGLGSMLAVLKVFGSLSSPGLLSFPRQGVTLALDFPNRGERLERLFKELDHIVQSAGGRLYPAKDGRMPGALFRSGYPRWSEFARFVDPRCSSSFWRRVMEIS
jgi:FAD/FMN-containing dehydrogenase